MVVIRLFCNAGMSTSLLVSRMRTSAEERGIEADIVAYATNEAGKRMSEADVALIGPQISYRRKEFQELAEACGVPFEVIPSVDYGMVNGERVLDLALGLVG